MVEPTTKNDWLDYPLSVIVGAFRTSVGSFCLSFAAIALGTFVPMIGELRLGNLVEELSRSGVLTAIQTLVKEVLLTGCAGLLLLVYSILFPLSWPFLVGVFIGLFRLLRCDGHPFWVFWLMTTCQFFVIATVGRRSDSSEFAWTQVGIGVLTMVGLFLSTVLICYVIAWCRRKSDRRPSIPQCQQPSDQ
ncbi:MAG: hypothetical protein HZA88_11030 [Verrucomicrobia bacterium]|nr:hypothetical protein [Verrucomicrobiota bacterium]